MRTWRFFAANAALLGVSFLLGACSGESDDPADDDATSDVGADTGIDGAEHDGAEGEDSSDPDDAGGDLGGTDVDNDLTDDVDESTPAPVLEFVEIPFDGERRIVTDMRFLPDGRSEFLTIEKDGLVSHYALDDDTVTALGEFTVSRVRSALDCGLLSIAFDPEFESNQYLYLGLCTSDQASGIYRYNFDTDDYDSIDDSGVEIISLEEPAARRPWHNVGSIGFDEDGVMWALFGDKTRADNGQDTATPMGAMLRIIPNREADGEGYTVPDDNPFVGVDGFAPEIYAYGLRSPWRGIRDHLGRTWIGDVGADRVEELNVVDQPGLNFGWRLAEGPCREDCDGLTDPLLHYSRSDEHDYVLDDIDASPASSRTVTVGLQYRDRGRDRYEGTMTNRVLFGDFCVGFIRAVEVDEDGALLMDAHVGHLEHSTGWDQGPDGYVYVATFGACETSNLDPPPVSRLYRAVLAE